MIPSNDELDSGTLKQESIDVREGELKVGDVPLYLKNCVVMEGEVLWKIKWAGNGHTKLLDSYETEQNLQVWDFDKFELLK